MTTVQDCIDQGYLRKCAFDIKLVEKELKEAEYDFGKAKHALEEEDFKWCIVKAYYSMFHAAKAVLFSLGLREKRHFAVGVVLEDLVKKGKLESRYVDYFSSAMEWRESADYKYTHSEEIATDIVANTEKFIFKMKGLLNRNLSQ
ncbi:MAG: HEPN domain-containing protein [Candidatus Aenigmarchaeota archaeon]|nr:HEPN domain-containing protein [Candidatus Aenigmarchaeota archaeon]